MASPEISVVFVGPEGVGKTSLARRLMHQPYRDNNGATIGASYIKLYVHEWPDGRREVCPHATPLATFRATTQVVGGVSIWDTAGQERYAPLLPMYTRKAHAIIGVYEGDADSADALTNMIQSIHSAAKVVVWRNKCDRELGHMRQRVGDVLACHQRLVSARTGEGVNGAFDALMSSFLMNDSLWHDASEPEISLHINDSPKPGTCGSCYY